NKDGSQERVLKFTKSQTPQNVSLSPDGKLIAFGAAYPGKELTFTLETMDVKTGDIKTVYKSNDPIQATIWLGDGSGLLAVMTYLEESNNQIYFVSYPGGKRERFTNDLTTYRACCLAITSDDKKLVAIQSSVSSDVFVVPNGDARQAKQVTSNEPLGFGLKL